MVEQTDCQARIPLAINLTLTERKVHHSVVGSSWASPADFDGLDAGGKIVSWVRIPFPPARKWNGRAKLRERKNLLVESPGGQNSTT
ncbi:hypothetical protein GQ457_06G024690 [Hibiscus cannabinus]